MGYGVEKWKFGGFERFPYAIANFGRVSEPYREIAGPQSTQLLSQRHFGQPHLNLGLILTAVCEALTFSLACEESADIQQKGSACRSQPSSASIPAEKTDPQFVFQLLDGSGQRGQVTSATSAILDHSLHIKMQHINKTTWIDRRLLTQTIYFL